MFFQIFVLPLQYNNTKLKLPLSKIVEIKTGCFAKPSPNSEIHYLQPRDFDDDGNLITQNFVGINKDEINSNHILQTGDILFAAKGFKNFAFIYDDIIGPSVASTSFFVLRLQNKSVLPEYINWFLNMDKTLTLIKSKAKGTSLPSISKETLSNIDIVFPMLEKQNHIIKLWKLKMYEKRLNQEIQHLKDHLLNQQLLTAITK